MKKALLIALAVVVAIVAVGFFSITNGLSEGAKVTLNGIDLTNTPDGSYTGTYDFKRWTNTVTVHVKDRRIVGIDMGKDAAFAGTTDCADEMFRRVMEAQNTQVDAVSGATVTSKAYLKAIENAFR